MSHFTTIQTQIKDIPVLRSACAELGLTVLENTTARGYGDNTHPGRFVIRLKGPYDIAVNRENDHFGLTADLWEGHVEKEVGKNFGRLLQVYGVHKTTVEARRRGLRVRRENLNTGEVKLILEGVR